MTTSNHNPKWNRWIRASIVRAFANLELTGVGKDYPGVKFDSTGAPAWVVLRLGKPKWQQQSPTVFVAEVDVNVLISVRLGEDVYQGEDISGLLTQWLYTPIELWSYGETTPEMLGCFRSADVESQDFGDDLEVSEAAVSTVLSFTFEN